MSEENVITFLQELGFEEIEIEDGLTALAVEFEPNGYYALLTNAEGLLPEQHKQSLIFAYYTPEGAYQWSASFKNTAAFKAIWSMGDSLNQKLETVQQYALSQEIE